MKSRVSNTDILHPPAILSSVSDTEFELHQEFLHRHIDSLIDILTGEEYQNGGNHPGGCPTATPEVQCRSRSPGQFPCRYTELTTQSGNDEGACICEDPLAGSDDPLDTVAAVSIACNDRTPAQRYFDCEDRRIIASLRRAAGGWDSIAELSRPELADVVTDATNREGFSDVRLERLITLLEEISDQDYTDGVTLRGLGGMQYDRFADVLSSLPGITQSDSWWLMLVAFDKPVWPVGPHVDGLLCSLGLIRSGEFNTEADRRTTLEESLVPRQIAAFHRALAGHGVKAGIDVCSSDCEIRKFLLTHRLRQQSELKDGPVAVDLFSGAGGLSFGFTKQDWSIELALDNDQDATDTYRLNHPEIPHEKVICGDICDELDNGLIETIGQSPDVVVGGPPCQSLSQAGYRARLANDEDYSILDDKRTSLYNQYVEIVDELRPKALVMENVEGMINDVSDTGIRVGDLVIDAIESIGASGSGYVCDYRLLDCSEFDVPQHRERIIILGIRSDLVDSTETNPIDNLFEELTDTGASTPPSLKQGLSGLPKLRRGEGGTVVPSSVRGSRSDYVEENNLGEGTDLCFNHRAREHPMSKDRTLFDEALEPGDTGWDVKYAKDGEYASLIEYDVGTQENPRFGDKYRMLSWKEPAPTVVAHLAKDANNFIIPDYYEYVSTSNGIPDNERNRGITPREAARLQSFPDHYLFLGSFTSWFRQIGNAVPPILGENIASVLRDRVAAEGIFEEHIQSSAGATGTDD